MVIGLPRRGEVWWVRVDKRRPAVVVQTDLVRESRIRSFLVVPLTTRMHLEGLPGNLRLDAATTHLPQASVANVYDVQKVFSDDFLERTAQLPDGALSTLDRGLRLVLGL